MGPVEKIAVESVSGKILFLEVMALEHYVYDPVATFDQADTKSPQDRDHWIVGGRRSFTPVELTLV